MNSRRVKQWVSHRFHRREDREPQCFAGNGAPVSATAADSNVAFEDRYALIALGCLHRSTFAAGTGSNDDDIILLWHIIQSCWGNTADGGRIRNGEFNSISLRISMRLELN